METGDPEGLAAMRGIASKKQEWKDSFVMKRLLLLGAVLVAFGLSPVLAECQGLQNSSVQTVSAKAGNHKARHKAKQKARRKAHKAAGKAGFRKHRHNR